MSKIIENLNLDRLSPNEARLFDKVAVTVRDPFNRLIGGLYVNKERDIDWLVSSVASRDINRSNLYKWCCQIRFIDTLLQQGWEIRTVNTSSPAMKVVLQEHLHGSSVKVVLNSRLRERIKTKIKGPAQFLWTAWNFLKQYCAALFYQDQSISFKQPLCLLDTFVLKTGFNGNEYLDRYYGRMLSLLSEKDRAEIYYLPTFYQISNYSKTYSDISNCRQNFLLKESYLTLVDYFSALGHPFRLSRTFFENVAFDGVSIKPLLDEELRNTHFSRSSMMGVLNYRFVRRLNQYRKEVRLLINWFENQAIDRGLVAGFSEFYPETQVIGYEGFTIPDSFIHMRPTQYEKDSNIIPRQIAVIGRELVEIVREFCPDLEVIVAPAFRFTGTWQERTTHPDPNRKTVLVVLSVDPVDCVEVLQHMLYVREHGSENYRFLIKPHPAMDVNQLRNSIDSEWPDDFEIATGDFVKALEISNMLVGYSSSTLMEALARGVPVIVIGSCFGLTQNPIPPNISQNIWRLCYTSEELLEAITFYSESDENMINSYEETGNMIREGFFEPVTPEGIKRFLLIDDETQHKEVR